MTISTDEYAFLSSDVYENRFDGNSVEYRGRKFQIEDSAMDPFTGFYARTYSDLRTGETVVAFRGTDDFLDAAVDGAMVSSRLDLQSFEAESYTRRAINAAAVRLGSGTAEPLVSVTGHSLGGGLAQLNAERFGLRGETFNAYGIVGLRGHEDVGGSQVINHVRATDIVSAASAHFGEVRVYATEADIATLKAAGYPGPGAHLGHAISKDNISAHYISDFVNTDSGPSIANDVTRQRYEDNRALVDEFRGDVLSSRSQLTAYLDQPALIGPSVMQRPAAAVATTLAGEALFVAGQAVADARAIQEGGSRLMDSARSAMRAIGDRFSDPNVAMALGSASYGAPANSPPSNRSDLRHQDHPGHALYAQAYDAVSRVDHQLGRTSDTHTERLAGSIAVAATRGGLERIDHAVLNSDGTRAYGVQGEFSSPHKRYVEVNTAQAVSTPIEQSSRKWHAASLAQQSDAQSQQATQAQSQTQQAAVRPQGP